MFVEKELNNHRGIGFIFGMTPQLGYWVPILVDLLIALKRRWFLTSWDMVQLNILYFKNPTGLDHFCKIFVFFAKYKGCVDLPKNYCFHFFIIFYVSVLTSRIIFLLSGELLLVFSLVQICWCKIKEDNRDLLATTLYWIPCWVLHIHWIM